MAHYRILVNLDCLLDVRLACVRQINESHALALVQNGYLDRDHNTLSLLYSKIDDQLVMEHWKRRDVATLKLSTRTKLIDTLAEMVSDDVVDKDNSPEQNTFKITINTYPYNLSKVEVRELFEGLSFLLGVKSIGRIHLPNEELTIAYLRDRYDKFIVYDFDEWYNDNIQTELREHPAPNLTCVRPFCYVAGQENNNEEAECIRWVTAAFSQHLDLEFVHLRDVSVFIPEHIVKPNQNKDDDES